MQKKRLRTLVVTLALAGLASGAQAIGFTAGGVAAVLGQTLDHVLGLRLDAGETLSPECVSAEVLTGEQRLPPEAVKVRIEGTGSALSLRVLTTAVIDEPVVTVAVSVGCPTRLSRRFVLFADPAPASLASAPIAPPVETLLPPVPEPRQARPDPANESRSTSAVPAPRSASAAAPASATEPAQAAAPPPRRPRAVARRPARAAEPAVPSAARSRLKLDAAEPAPLPPSAITAEIIAAAASAAAAQATLEAGSAAAARIANLEKSIEKMRSDAVADREALRVLRQRAIDGDKASALMWVLVTLVGLLALLAVWLGLKLRRLQIERQQTWWNAAAGAANAGTDETPTAVNPSLAPAELPSTVAPISTRPGGLSQGFKPDPELESQPEPEPPVTERTQVMPVGWREDPEPARDVTIEELIDLEQQAEFFIVLGQEEAAVDLLVDHLRVTGGGSPMPYLKLLEIYRRRGDQEAYERTRARFNHRFNAYAPDWDAEGHEGRWLEDYPSIVARLQMAWPSPIDAMAELESLLFRKARGDLFDMPAYRDVLFLYSLARDLLDREPLGSNNVDVLLPINDGSDFTQPMSLDSGASALDSGLVQLDVQPTVPIDLDITQPSTPESLFGEPAETAKGSRRRRRP